MIRQEAARAQLAKKYSNLTWALGPLSFLFINPVNVNRNESLIMAIYVFWPCGPNHRKYS